MFLSKRSNGVYYLWYYDELGKKQKVSTRCTYKADALKFLQHFKQKEYQNKQKVKNKTLSQFIEEFLNFAKGNYPQGTYGIYRSVLQQFLITINDCFLASITPQHVDKFKVNRLARISPITVNIELRTLKAAFYTAMRWKLIENNPVSSVKPAQTPEIVPCFLKKEDFQKLISLIKEQWLREVVVFAVMTGMRRGEIVNLKWHNVDFQRKLISIESSPTFRTKQGKLRSIPLNDVAVHLLLSRQGKNTSEFVFTLNNQKISEGWLSHKFKYYVYEAKLSNDKLHFHSLRHTFASWLVQDGVSLYEVQKLLGHSNISVTQVYSHLQPETLHATVNKITLQLN